MPKKTVPDLKELFKQAAEIAQQVPESMQQAAFNRAVDLLTGTSSEASAQPNKNMTGRITKPRMQPQSGDESSPNALLDQIDSTQHPGVRSATKVLDRALMVLQIALADHQVDGLGPTEIARILTDKFRVNTTRQAVSMALGGATNLVNRIPRDRGFVYRIMGPGEEYLAHQGKAGEHNAESPVQIVTRTRGKSAKKTNKSKGAATGMGTSGKKSGAKRSASFRGIGPKAAIGELIESGFFKSAKTGPAVQEYLKKKRGFDLGTDQLRLAMLRLVRDGALERDENEEGQYEYTQV